ncbi:MAG: SpoIID/LytB domain-containing protein [Myxococcota bacterium]
MRTINKLAAILFLPFRSSFIVHRFSFIILIFLILPQSAYSWQMVRVAVYKSVKEITITGDDLKIGVITKDGLVGEVVGVNPKTTRILIENNRLFIKGVKSQFDAVTVACPSGWLNIDNTRYHAPIEIVADTDAKLIVAVNEINIEDYLLGVLSSEAPSSWHIEALKAQAVAARTFALFQILNSQSKFYHLEASVSDQVYGGIKNFPESIIRAIEETRGIALAYNNQPIQAYFHSCCGGIGTESAKLVWGNDLPYLPGVKCDYCKRCPRRSWSVKLGAAELEKSLSSAGFIKGALKGIEVSTKTPSGRARKLNIKDAQGERAVDVNQFRGAIGYDRIYSSAFSISKEGDAYIFKGNGFGHGVGMCQWGAYGMAAKGKDYKQILKHYYPSAELIKMY